MNTWVIDASVAAKWFLPPADEEFTAKAISLLDGYKAGEMRFVVPGLFWAEFGNIVWKAVRRHRVTRAAAEISVSELRMHGVPTISSEQLLPQAMKIAMDFQRSVYDALYVALAIEVRTQLLTADERLANAVNGQLPVTWLGTL